MRPYWHGQQTHKHFRLHRHSRTEVEIRILARFEIDSHRNSLHYLHVIPGCILWREQAESGSGSAADACDPAAVHPAGGVNTESHPLARMHPPELRLLEIRDD